MTINTSKSAARLLTAIISVALFATSSLTAQNVRGNRITQSLSAKANVAEEIRGTVHPMTQLAVDMGMEDPGRRLKTITLDIAPSKAQNADITALQVELQDPKSPRYHKWLTQEEYGKLFGLTDSDLSQVTSWLKGQGFTVKAVSPSRNSISFSATVGQAEAAFRTQIHRYRIKGQEQFANATVLSIPAPFAGVVANVRGLDNFRVKPNAKATKINRNFTSGSGDHYLSPSDWATIYNVNPMYSALVDGSGIHIGVVGQTYAPKADIDNFRSVAGLPATKLTYYCMSSSDCTTAAGIQSGDLAEADLDIEWSGAIAKNATVDYVYTAGNDSSMGVFSALQFAIQNYKAADGNVLPIISMSYATCEAEYPPPLFAWIDSLGKQANLQGQTIVVASGDSGAAGCDLQGDPISVPAFGGRSVTVPSDSPNFTAVGGTVLSGDTSAPVEYWQQTPNQVNTAIQYIPEMVWNESDATGLSASGGGESAIPVGWTSLAFPQPIWQNGLVQGTTGRMVPDISFASAANHNGYLSCTSDFNSAEYGTMCADGFYSSGGTSGSQVFYSIGGTSVATPAFAGMLALVMQRTGPLGNINPTLYALAGNPATYSEVFHDVTGGDNIVPCASVTFGCDNGQMGYTANAGYDMATGLGSLKGNALLSALTAGTSQTTTTVLPSSQSMSMGSDSLLNIIATVESADKTNTITGSVEFKVGNTVIATSPIANGTANTSVLVIADKGFVVGSDTISATYTGDSHYQSSVGSAVMTVTRVLAVTSTAVTAEPSVLTLGGTTTLSAKVTPSTATGMVTFKVGNKVLGGAATVSNGVATLKGVAVTTANGFSTGSVAITASYSGDQASAQSDGNTAVTLPTYSVAPEQTILSSSTSSNGTVKLNLTSTAYSGTVNFKVSVQSNTSSSNISASVPAVALSSGGTGTATLSFTTNERASNHVPKNPWNSGAGFMVCAVLAGVPFTSRRKIRQASAVLVVLFAITMMTFSTACAGFFPPHTRNYTITITPTGTGTVVDAAPISVTVTVTDISK